MCGQITDQYKFLISNISYYFSVHGVFVSHLKNLLITTIIKNINNLYSSIKKVNAVNLIFSNLSYFSYY